MKKLLVTSLGIAVIFLFVLSPFNAEVISKPAVITYCYQSYTDNIGVPCEWVPGDCGCVTINNE
ncbi:MAG: hypothetical protein Q8K98_14230 [Bacteroidota bacterium]|nr:hypothetical protein [Bacteroidota bacterium]